MNSPAESADSPKSTWNPEQYARFRAERNQPFFDLLALVQPQPNMRVVDLGCGTGELTRALHSQLRARETLGVDRSETMLAQSGAFAGDGLRFELGDLREFAAGGADGAGERYDLIFSNAALQWVPEHEALLRLFTDALSDRGQLAIQVPANDDDSSHTVAVEVASEPPFAGILRGTARYRMGVLQPEAYARLLDRLGYREQHVRLQVYVHHLASREEVVEWVKGSLLTDYQQRLPPDLYTEFLVRYRERLLSRLEDTRPHFYPFKRILFWGRSGR